MPSPSGGCLLVSCVTTPGLAIGLRKWLAPGWLGTSLRHVARGSPAPLLLEQLSPLLGRGRPLENLHKSVQAMGSVDANDIEKTEKLVNAHSVSYLKISRVQIAPQKSLSRRTRTLERHKFLLRGRLATLAQASAQCRSLCS